MIARPDQFDEDGDQLPIVPFVPFRCPQCGRHKPFTNTVRGRMRYHRCQHCGTKYRSFELSSDSIGPDWKPPPAS